MRQLTNQGTRSRKQEEIKNLAYIVDVNIVVSIEVLDEIAKALLSEITLFFCINSLLISLQQTLNFSFRVQISNWKSKRKLEYKTLKQIKWTNKRPSNTWAKSSRDLTFHLPRRACKNQGIPQLTHKLRFSIENTNQQNPKNMIQMGQAGSQLDLNTTGWTSRQNQDENWAYSPNCKAS